MRLLFATPAPPVRTKPRPHAFVRGLAAAGHEVHLLAAVPSPRELERLPERPDWRAVADACASVSAVVTPFVGSALRCARSLPSTTPLRVAYCEDPRFRRVAAALAERLQPDVVHVDRERLARVFRGWRGPKVLDATDAISLYNRRLRRHGRGVERVLATVDAPRMARFERQMAAGYDACLLAGVEDHAALSTGAGGERFHLLPNGVEDRFLGAERREVPGRVVFVGTLHYPPNVDAALWFADHVLPRLGGAHLHLVGARPHPAVRRLGRRPDVTVHADVPDVLPFLEEADVFVSPVRVGGGFPNKVAEALAAGVPTVTTTAGAGLPGAVPGEHLLVADDAAAMARAVDGLLGDRHRKEALGRAGRELVAARFRWDDVVAGLERLHGATVAAAR